MTKFTEEINKSWTLFLDRDGVINKRIFGGYVSNWNDFELLDGVLEAIKIFSSVFKNIIVVTNQQGLGKGLMHEAQLNEIHSKFKDEVFANSGKIDAIYYCGDLVTKPDNCRKPGIKMAEKAKNDFPEIDFNKSIMIGDSASDIMFGKNAGMKTVLKKSEEIVDAVADIEVNSLLEFAHLLIEK